MLSVPAGVQALFLEVKEIRKIKSKMSHQRLSVQQLPYREMERLRQVRCGAWDAFWCCLALPPHEKGLEFVCGALVEGLERPIPHGEARSLPKNRVWKLGPGLLILREFYEFGIRS